MMTSDILFSAVVLSWVIVTPLFRSTRVPPSVLIIFSGILLGPTVLSWLAFTESIKLLSELAIILILFNIGLGVHKHQFALALKPGLIVAVIGIVASGTLGFFISLNFYSDIEQALYLSVALSATSIGLSVPLLKQQNLLDTSVGQILLAAAVIDDILAMYLLSTIHVGLDQQGELNKLIIKLITGGIVLTIVILSNMFIAKLVRIQFFIRFKLCALVLLSITALLSSILTWHVDMSVAVGAFLSGSTLAWCGIDDKKYIWVRKPFSDLFNVAIPTFFVTIGLQMTTISFESATLWSFALCITIAALAGKIFSGWVIPINANARMRWILGAAMTPRGEVGLVVASIGLKQGHLNQHAVMAIVIMTVITTIIPALLIPLLAHPAKQIVSSTYE